MWESGGGDKGPTHGLSIIDTKSFKHIGDVAGLPGNSNEGMVVDRAGKKLYVNLTGTDEVGVIDLNTGQPRCQVGFAGRARSPCDRA